MNNLQPYLIESAHPQAYELPRLKHLPVREQPAFRVARDSDACSLAELLAVIIGGSTQIETAERLLSQFGSIQKIVQPQEGRPGYSRPIKCQILSIRTTRWSERVDLARPFKPTAWTIF